MLDYRKAVTSLVILSILAVVATFLITQPIPVPEEEQRAAYSSPPPVSKVDPLAAIPPAKAPLDLKIRKYYDRLGFVTLTQGEQIGLKEGEILEVVRNGEILGELKVTSVAASAASADVLPNSRIEKILQAGDLARPVAMR